MQHASIGLQAASTSTLETQLQQAYVLKIEALPCCFALSHSKLCFMCCPSIVTASDSLAKLVQQTCRPVPARHPCRGFELCAPGPHLQ